MSRKLSIAVAPSAKSAKWTNKQIEWEELVQKLSEPSISQESFSEYKALTKEEQSAKKDVGGFVGGYLNDGKRTASSLRFRDVLCLDLDFASSDIITLIEGQNPRFAAVIHSTRNHSSKEPRFRIIAPLSRSCDALEYEAVGRRIADKIGMQYFDPSSFQPVRLMYWPSRCRTGEWEFHIVDNADWLDVDEVLSSYVDYTNISEWPRHELIADQERAIHSGEVADPLQKKGVVGAFCRAYPIEEALSEFLSEVYRPTEDMNRYSYIHGSGTKGLVVYSDKASVYSNHGTDPAYGKLCNAFDIVRIHKFGEDGGGKDSKSYKEMVDWALTLPEVRRDAVEAISDEHKFEAGDGGDWREALEIGSDRKPTKSAWNLELIFDNDEELKGKFAKNLFDSKLYLTRSTKGLREVNKPVPIADVDMSILRRYLENTYGIDTWNKAKDALLISAQARAFHPIKEYLDALEWDGIPRIFKVLRDVFGVAITDYSQEILKKWMTAAVARVYEPGTKFDEMLVAVGEQGTEKSTFFRKLAINWFSDTFFSVSGKEAFEQLRGAWIMEIAELAGFKKADLESVKHFVSKTHDEYRKAYGEVTEVYPRQVVFAATTNELTFLVDVQNRRYWPFRVDKEKATMSVYSKAFDALIPKLWAEAVANYRAGGSLVLSRDASEEAEGTRREFMASDERSGLIAQYLDHKLPADWGVLSRSERVMWLTLSEEEMQARGELLVERDSVAAIEVWCECLGRSKEDASRRNLRDINDMLRKMYGWREAQGLRTFGEYGRQRYYTRK